MQGHNVSSSIGEEEVERGCRCFLVMIMVVMLMTVRMVLILRESLAHYISRDSHQELR